MKVNLDKLGYITSTGLRVLTGHSVRKCGICLSYFKSIGVIEPHGVSKHARNSYKILDKGKLKILVEEFMEGGLVQELAEYRSKFIRSGFVTEGL